MRKFTYFFLFSEKGSPPLRLKEAYTKIFCCQNNPSWLINYMTVDKGNGHNENQ